MSTELTTHNPSANIGTIKLKTLSFKTPRKLYALHRFLFRLTNGVWNDTVGSVLSAINGRYDNIDTTTSMFKFTEADVEKIAETIERDGYCILDQTLSDEVIANITKFGQVTPVRAVLPSESYAKGGSQFSEEALVETYKNKSARCVHDTAQALRSSDVQKIALEPLLLSIAQTYLKIKPILSSIVLWWSFPVQDNKKFTAAAAQEYHFDLDRIRWLNFFIYLTDVDSTNGPHCYVKGSHKRLPPQFRRRGRFSDEEVGKYYGSDVIELTGKKGTIMAVDTRGLHKGKALEQKHRLILQVGFSNSLFGEYYEKSHFENLSNEKKNFVTKYFETYFNFL